MSAKCLVQGEVWRQAWGKRLYQVRLQLWFSEDPAWDRVRILEAQLLEDLE